MQIKVKNLKEKGECRAERDKGNELRWEVIKRVKSKLNQAYVLFCNLNFSGNYGGKVNKA